MGAGLTPEQLGQLYAPTVPLSILAALLRRRRRGGRAREPRPVERADPDARRQGIADLVAARARAALPAELLATLPIEAQPADVTGVRPAEEAREMPAELRPAGIEPVQASGAQVAAELAAQAEAERQYMNPNEFEVGGLTHLAAPVLRTGMVVGREVLGKPIAAGERLLYGGGPISDALARQRRLREAGLTEPGRGAPTEVEETVGGFVSAALPYGLAHRVVGTPLGRALGTLGAQGTVPRIAAGAARGAAETAGTFGGGAALHAGLSEYAEGAPDPLTTAVTEGVGALDPLAGGAQTGFYALGATLGAVGRKGRRVQDMTGLRQAGVIRGRLEQVREARRERQMGFSPLLPEEALARQRGEAPPRIRLPAGAPEVLGGTPEQLATREAERAEQGTRELREAERQRRRVEQPDLALLTSERGSIPGEPPPVPEPARLPQAGEVLHSRLARAVDRAPFSKGTAAQWRAALSKDVPVEERELTGVDAFLTEHEGKVLTREQVRDRVLREGQILYSGLDPSLLKRLPPEAAGAAVGAGVGAAVGAQDDEALKGAAVGALAGLGGGRIARALRARRPAVQRGAAAVAPEAPPAPRAEGFEQGTPEADRAMAELRAEVRAGRAAEAPAVPPDFFSGLRRQAEAREAGTPPPRADDYVNLSKLDLDPAGEQRLREEVERLVVDVGIHPKEVVPWTRTRQIAGTLGFQDLAGLQVNKRLSGPEMLAIRNVVSGNVDRLERMSGEVGELERAGTAEALARRDLLLRAQRALEQQNRALLERFIRARTETGRDLNNLKIVAARTLDPVYWLAKARQYAGEAGFTEEVQGRVRRLLAEGDRDGVIRYVLSLKRTPVPEQLLTLWKAGLLTNPVTHVVNFTGNMSMAAVETLKDAPAAVWDRLLGLATKRRTLTGLTAGKLRAAVGGPAGPAAQRLSGLVTGGRERFDVQGTTIDFLPNSRANALLDSYQRAVFGALEKGDRPFVLSALRRSLADQAEVLARREGARGVTFKARVAELLATPTDEMAAAAIADAETATFKQRTALGRAAAGLARSVPGGQLILPFQRTPGAVGTMVLEYSGLGFATGGWDAFRVFREASQGKDVSALQRRAAQRLGRATTGTLGPVAVGYWLGLNGLATGSYPQDAGEAQRWRLEGRQENSVLVGGRWVKVGRISPVGNLIATGANVAQAATAGNRSIPEALLFGAARSVLDQPFLQGIEQVQESLREAGSLKPSRSLFGTFGRRLAGSAVPAGVAAVARGVDPTVRRPETIEEEVATRIPGLGGGVTPAVGPLGEPVQRTGAGVAGRLVEALFNPTALRADQRAADPLVGELARVGYAVPRVARRKGESGTDYAARQQVYGRAARAALEQAVASEAYQGIPAQAAAEVTRLRASDERLAAYPEEQLLRAAATALQREVLEDAVTRVRRQVGASFEGRP